MADVTEYVVGFAFDKKRENVALIQKNRPPWQKGKLNGIGGHIEAEAAVRWLRETMARSSYSSCGFALVHEPLDFVTKPVDKM